jgi:hypothetical protein
MTVHEIVADKEAQRRQAGGTFLWGIGNRVGLPTINELVRLVDEPEVLFSRIKEPRPEDIAPECVVRWTAATAAVTGDDFELPPGARVISRWNRKRPRHDALVCWSDTPLAIEDGRDRVSPHALRNLLSGKPVANQQITVVVQRMEAPLDGHEYPVVLRARLIHPYFLRMVKPVEVGGSHA